MEAGELGEGAAAGGWAGASLSLDTRLPWGTWGLGEGSWRNEAPQTFSFRPCAGEEEE